MKHKHILVAGVAALAVAGSLFGATAAQAGITFDYISQPFTEGVVDGQPASLNIPVYGASLSGSVTFDNTVTNNFTGTVGASDVTNWALTSGPLSLSSVNNNTISGQDIDLQSATFTFTNGAITDWAMIAYPSPFAAIGQTVLNAKQDSNFAGILTQNGTGSGNQTGSLNPSGTWSVSTATAAPEPASLALFGTSLIGLALIRRRRV